VVILGGKLRFKSEKLLILSYLGGVFMGVSFKFWAYGILAIAALAMVLYVSTSLAGRGDVGQPLLWITVFIVVAFVIYMFAKRFVRG